MYVLILHAAMMRDVKGTFALDAQDVRSAESCCWLCCPQNC